MSSVKIQSNVSGTGSLTIAAPNTNTDRTLTLPDESGTLLSSASQVAASQITTALNASGSAPIYACRAWVNFNGTGTVAIRASGNVSSITDNGAGNYTVNFTTALPDADYVQQFYVGNGAGSGNYFTSTLFYAPSSASCRCLITDQANNQSDVAYVNVAIFR